MSEVGRDDAALAAECAALTVEQQRAVWAWVEARRASPMDEYTLADLQGIPHDQVGETALPAIAARLDARHQADLLRAGLAQFRAERDAR